MLIQDAARIRKSIFDELKAQLILNSKKIEETSSSFESRVSSILTLLAISRILMTKNETLLSDSGY